MNSNMFFCSLHCQLITTNGKLMMYAPFTIVGDVRYTNLSMLPCTPKTSTDVLECFLHPQQEMCLTKVIGLLASSSLPGMISICHCSDIGPGLFRPFYNRKWKGQHRSVARLFIPSECTMFLIQVSLAKIVEWATMELRNTKNLIKHLKTHLLKI